MATVVWTSEKLAWLLRERLSSRRVDAPAAPTVVRSVREFLDATRDPRTVSFVDGTTLGAVAELTHVSLPGPVVAICEQALTTALGWLRPNPWVSHVMSASILQQPIGEELLANVLRALAAKQRPRLADWIEPGMTGRRIRLTHASRRAARLERMVDYLETHRVSTRTAHALRDAAEELLTNAFYDAPVAAGALKAPVPRTQDISLPESSACDLTYGCRDDLAIVRVRDPFGSLTRGRLLEVLDRCARTDMAVKVDDSMGGAGLGMFRILSVASFVGISVVQGRSTEIVVGIAKRAPGARPYALHVFFRASEKRRFWSSVTEDTKPPSAVNLSVMVIDKPR